MTVEPRKPNSLTIEHVRARSSGGVNAQTNLVAACAECNESRGSTDAYQFFETREEAVKVFKAGRRISKFAQGSKATLAEIWPAPAS